MIERVKKILSDYTSIDMENVNEETELISDLELNSLDVINIIVDFEDEFDIEIPDQNVSKLKTVGDIVRYLEEKNVSE